MLEDVTTAWFTASSHESQRQAVDALVTLSQGSHWPSRTGATTALIELMHLTLNPSERTFLVSALGRCTDSFQAVPALHAETQHPDTAVRREALRGIGRLGIPFGGCLVDRFLRQRDLEDEPREVLGVEV